MRTFRPNNKRNRFRTNDRGFKRNGESQRFNGDFNSNSSFKRKIPGKNNHNASKLIEKYTDLAKEALSNGDQILSENYFQHADHFIRILGEQEKNKSIRVSENNKLPDSSTNINMDKKTDSDKVDTKVEN
jgi:hypothetical protein